MDQTDIIPIASSHSYSFHWMGRLHHEPDPALSVNMSDWDAFIGVIPFQFYAFLAIFIVPLVSVKGLDFGPMAKTERDCQA